MKESPFVIQAFLITVIVSITEYSVRKRWVCHLSFWIYFRISLRIPGDPETSSGWQKRLFAI